MTPQKSRLSRLLSLLSTGLMLAACSTGGSKPAAEDDLVMDFFRTDPKIPFAAPSPQLINAQGRDYRSLNGPWDILVDEAGFAWRTITEGDYYSGETVFPDTGMHLLEASFDSRKQLQVPGDWNSQVPELDRYRGKLFYYRAIALKPRADKRYFLHFGGANYTTDLFVNNKPVGRHVGGYTSFDFDITKFLQPGENRIIVRVDAHLDDSTIPTMRSSDFWKYGGLIGDVGLITEPKTSIGQYHVYLKDIASGEIRGWVQLLGDDVANREVKVAIVEAGVTAIVRTGTNGRGEFSVKEPHLKLWSPQSPYLYNVALSTDMQTLHDRIGFRTIATDGTKLLLNGKPIKLRGIAMHEETTLHPGISTSREDALSQFKLVKQLHANFVRLAHYPHNEHTLRLADEMGLMIWSEVPIVSLIDWSNPATLAVAKSQVSENVTRDMNRAAIIAWSVSNESFPQSQARLDFLTELATIARSLDNSSRPIASALVGDPRKAFVGIGKAVFGYLLRKPDLDPAIRQRLMAMAKQAAAAQAKQGGAPTSNAAGDEINVNIDDPLGKVVDIVGYNEYFGWYYSRHFAQSLGIDEGLMREAMLAVMPKIRFTDAFHKPIIISEFGAGAKAGLHSEKVLVWSEEYQAKVYRAQLKMLPKSPYIVGFSPWVLKDFRSHLRELNGIQDTYNRKGLVSETGQKKLAFDVLAEFYRQQQESAASGGQKP